MAGTGHENAKLQYGDVRVVKSFVKELHALIGATQPQLRRISDRSARACEPRGSHEALRSDRPTDLRYPAARSGPPPSDRTRPPMYRQGVFFPRSGRAGGYVQ